MVKDGGRILMVEDNPDHADLTIRALRRHNLQNEIDVVGDGADALDYLFGRDRYEGRRPEELPVLVLLDLKLPKVDGLEVLQALRGDPRTRVLPVVVLTSSNEERDIVASYHGGANSYIRKPVDFHEFTEAVGKLGLYWLLLNEPPPGVPEP